MDRIEELKNGLAELENEIRSLTAEVNTLQERRDYLSELRLLKMKAINEELQRQIDETTAG